MKYTITTQREIRAFFWQDYPRGTRRPGWTQNQYPTDIRVAFCDFVDHLRRGEEISKALANRATL